MEETGRCRRYAQFALLVTAAGVLYPLLYLRTNYQTAILEAFGLSVSELSDLYALLGLMFVAGYMPSGWLADRFRARYLLPLSLLMCGGAGLWFAQIPPRAFLKPIFIAWGIFGVFTFWGSLVKSVKLLAHSDEQSRFFGILDGGRGVLEALLASVTMTVFKLVLDHHPGQSVLGFRIVVVIYAASCLVLALAIFTWFGEEPASSSERPASDSSPQGNLLQDTRQVLTLKEVWLLSCVIFCGYSAFWTIYCFGGFLQASHQASQVLAGYVTVAMMWMRPIGGVLSGFLGDRFDRMHVLVVSLFLTALGLCSLSVLPRGQAAAAFVIVLATSLVIYMIRGLYWSLLDHCPIPVATLGLGIGCISFLGYLPDLISPIVSGRIFLHYGDGPQAYTAYFALNAGVAVIGAGVTLLWSARWRGRCPDARVPVLAGVTE